MRDRVSHREIVRSEQAKVASAIYKVGDVITTIGNVSCINWRGKREGVALPGWLWRIVEVNVNYSESGARWVNYGCVAHLAPRMYSCRLREGRVSQKVGRHEGELLGGKVMTQEEALRNFQLNKQDEIEKMAAAVGKLDLQPAQLWAPGEAEALQAQLTAAADAADRQQPEPPDEDSPPEPPVDLTDPLSHIRELILPDCPKAAFATDEELEVLYDEWQAKQEEQP